MDFFERQENARKGTKRLLLLFGAGVLGLTVAVYLAVLLVFAGLGHSSRSRVYDPVHAYGRTSEPGLWNPSFFFGSAAGTLAIVLLGSAFKASELSKGGRAVASMLGGVPVSPNTLDLDERKLMNIVEEMSLASGIPVPQVFILPQEDGINAFAAGHTPGDAAIGVTRGAVRLLNREELQGVIGHEFSHILNGDMRLNMRLMAYVFGILCLTIIGRVLLRTRGRKNPLPLLGLALILIGWIGVVFGRMIQAAVSRQREYLADASAAQFTRNPVGLASALKKIGGLAQGSRLVSPQAAQASHMFFGNGLRSSFLGLFATHPPLEKRIQALDPSFNGKYPVVADAALLSRRSASATHAGPVSGLFGTEWKHAQPAPPPAISPAEIIRSVGAPRPAHIRYAVRLRTSFPEAVTLAARESSGAAALVFTLLLSDDEVVRFAQVREITAAMGQEMASEVLRLHPVTRQAAIRARLPLVDLALPALRQLSPKQYNQFRTALEKVVDADGEIDLFEYMIQKIVLRHLNPHFIGVRPPVVQFYSLKGLAPDCGVLLSGLAHIGGDDPETVRTAFAAGAEKLSYAAQASMELVSPEECGLDRVDAALERISQAVPQIRKNVLTACALTVSADGLIKEQEVELLRGVADALDCPIPPMIAEAA